MPQHSRPARPRAARRAGAPGGLPTRAGAPTRRSWRASPPACASTNAIISTAWSSSTGCAASRVSASARNTADTTPPGPSRRRTEAAAPAPRRSSLPLLPDAVMDETPAGSARAESLVALREKIEEWCPRPDSNRHGVAPTSPLKLACLPVPPLGQAASGRPGDARAGRRGHIAPRRAPAVNAPPRARIRSSAVRLGVHGVAQPLAEQVEGEHDDEDGRARNEGEPRGRRRCISSRRRRCCPSSPGAGERRSPGSSGSPR